ncbi:helix-turn-helix transcriptional regulator [Amycolatopsis sp., V23-08]|uniref:Helix-turn-helix transcriptional regulator n=1 Tax=Amycolatopsis heterodermiae TaxID=3110235 RepID=A0ABU5R8T1_9PSEU|nr:helix-turn-helix transcriptional regulator [Amycolatopsis sp., V23-08]MEA5362627.1 helix-turn-helix transcriptional regulator [Amycolatopsis sp., V23-08]
MAEQPPQEPDSGTTSDSGRQRFQFATTDPDEAQDFIDRMYRAQPPKAGRLARVSPVSISQVSAGGLSYVDFTMPPDLTLHLDGTDEVSVTTLITGGTEAELGKHTERYVPGDAFLGSFPHGDYQVRCLDFRATILTVPAHALAEAAGILPGRPPPELRFDTLRPVSPAAAALWKRTATYAHDMLENELAAASPLIMGSAARHLAATILEVFPGTVRTDPLGPGSRDARPETLRRAIAFIDDNAHTDITVADVAAAAFVTPRAVQLAFRRHLGTTPMAYLRRVRLDRAHHELLATDRGHGSVTATAYRWGFSNPGRFATGYRNAYGVLPSQTLDRDA